MASRSLPMFQTIKLPPFSGEKVHWASTFQKIALLIFVSPFSFSYHRQLWRTLVIHVLSEIVPAIWTFRKFPVNITVEWLAFLLHILQFFRDQLFRLRSLLVFLGFSRKKPGKLFKLRHGCFSAYHFQFINHSSILHYTTWATDAIVIRDVS
jgi:hypothetical protein